MLRAAYRLASQMHCTVAELRQRVTAGEFAHWQAWWALEDTGPQAERERWAALMAAACNGPITRKDKRLWRAADFLPDPNALPGQPPPKAKPATGAQAAQFVKRMRAAEAEVRANRKARA